jgi:Cof subfamily protein (haloacid dehalogenase superfamily)
MTRKRAVRPGLPKMVASDLDGTLVRSDDTVSEYTKAVLQRVRAAGIPVVGATGRGPRLADLTRADLGEVDYLVLAAGGRVLDLTDQANPVVLRDARLDGAVLLDVLARLEERVGPLSVLVEALDGQNSPLWGDPNPLWRYPDVVEEMPRHQALAGAVIKTFARAVAHDADQLLAVATEVIPPELATLTQSGLGYVEILPPQVDKATGLAVVAEQIGVDPQDVLVFGDMPNDLPMFAWAGFGRVAVPPAHPAVLAVADDVAESNDDDGVAKYLDRLLSNG